MTFTLPPVQLGLTYRFFATAAQNCVVSANTTGTASIKGCNGASSGAGPASAISGNTLTCTAGTAADQNSFLSLESDGTLWYVSNLQGQWTVTTA